MAKEKKYAVIRFCEDNVIEIVSTTWISSTEHDSSTKICWFPHKGGTLKAKTHAKTSANEGELYECKILGIYEDYGKARQKLKIAEDTDNLETTDMEIAKTPKRKITKNKKFWSDSDSDREFWSQNQSAEHLLSIPAPPVPPSSSSSLKTPRRSCPTPRRSPRIQRLHTRVLSEDSETQFFISPSSRPRPTNQSTSTAGISKLIREIDTELGKELEQLLEPPNSEPSQSPMPDSQRHADKEPTSSGNLESMLQSIYRIVVRIEGKVDSLCQPQVAPNVSFNHLPLRNIEAFENHEKSLRDPSYRDALEKLLSTQGGSNARSLIFAMMKTTMSDDLAMKMSLSGKSSTNTKSKFQDTKLYQLIHGLCTRKFRSETNLAIRCAISDWLSQSKTRRSRRNPSD